MFVEANWNAGWPKRGSEKRAQNTHIVAFTLRSSSSGRLKAGNLAWPNQRLKGQFQACGKIKNQESHIVVITVNQMHSLLKRISHRCRWKDPGKRWPSLWIWKSRNHENNTNKQLTTLTHRHSSQSVWKPTAKQFEKEHLIQKQQMNQGK